MCGIVGYLGPQDPKEVILNGLKKLEYRGYDSAGIAIIEDGTTKRFRASGKLRFLEDKIRNEVTTGHTGIGHTRWATHGAPSEANAHPHKADGISIVHNGIIENFQELREELLKKGRKVESQTDSEVIAHMIALERKATGSLIKAVEKIIPHLRGAYAVLAICEDTPDEIIGFKQGPPLVIGIGDKQNYFASDIQALVNYTNKFIYLDDNEVAVLKSNSFQIYGMNAKPIKKEITEIKWDAELIEKQGYPFFMLKEIFEQSRTVGVGIEPIVDKETHKVIISPEREKIMREMFAEASDLRIVACGTSNYAGQLAKYLFEKIARLDTEVDIASEFRYRDPVFDKKTIVMLISQSGETADTLAALRLVKGKGIKVLSVCNVTNSTIARESDYVVPMQCGAEIGVASTKAFTSTLVNLVALAVQSGKQRGHLNGDQEQKICSALLALPSQIDAVLTYDKYFQDAAIGFQKFKGFLFMGRGVSFPIALEGALKLKELAYLHAEGYAAGEMKHGPLALIDDRMAVVMLAPSDDLYEKTVSNLEEARARGAKVLSIGTGDNQKLREVSDFYIGLPDSHWALTPILAVVPLQLMAYHMANSFGYDVDQPRNLAKSVTVE